MEEGNCGSLKGTFVLGLFLQERHHTVLTHPSHLLTVCVCVHIHGTVHTHLLVYVGDHSDGHIKQPLLILQSILKVGGKTQSGVLV